MRVHHTHAGEISNRHHQSCQEHHINGCNEPVHVHDGLILQEFEVLYVLDAVLSLTTMDFNSEMLCAVKMKSRKALKKVVVLDSSFFFGEQSECNGCNV